MKSSFNLSLGSYFPSMLKTYGLGLALSIASTLILFATDTIGHLTHPSVVCMFFENLTGGQANINSSDAMHLQLDISPAVLVAVNILNILSLLLINTSALKFILAQSPQSMKGVLIGLFIFFEGIYNMFGALIFQVILETFKNIKNPFTHPSCGFYYYLTNLVLAIMAFVLFCAAAKGYKYRERAD